MSTNRYVCQVLEEIRASHKSFRMDRIPGLIEEVQTMVNKMEAKLQDYRDMGYDLSRCKELADKLKAYSKQVSNIEDFLKPEKSDVELGNELYQDVMDHAP
jgi:hypothetical protein